MVDAGGLRQQTRTHPPAAAGAGSPTVSIVNRLIILITIVLRVILWPLRRLSVILFPPKEFDGITQSADQAARAFATTFQTRYLHTSTTESSTLFSTVGFAKSLVKAYRENHKMTLVYLYSPIHPASDRFCREVLSHPRTVEAISGILCWGASVHTADGAHASRLLHVTSYPYVALLASGANHSSSSHRVDVLWKMTYSTGMTLDQFLRAIQIVQRGYANVMAEVEMRRLRREQEIHLRQEQDREYQEALIADQQREAERQAVAQAEREAREEEERQVREETHRKQNALAEAKSLLPEEPAAGTPSTTRLRITLPSGVKVDRRFAKEHQIRHVRAFLTVYLHNQHEENEQNHLIENFELSSNYPKRTWTDHDVTLEEAGLSPMAVLMLQDLDA